jgi:hypothetical protein
MLLLARLEALAWRQANTHVTGATIGSGNEVRHSAYYSALHISPHGTRLIAPLPRPYLLAVGDAPFVVPRHGRHLTTFLFGMQKKYDFIRLSSAL